MKFALKLGSCYRLRCSLPPPSTSDTHGVPLNASGSDDLHRTNRNRSRRRRSSQWRPALWPIMEDRVTQDHQNSVNQKSDKKPSNKGRSAADIPYLYSNDARRKSSSLEMSLPLFAATPFMF